MKLHCRFCLAFSSSLTEKKVPKSYCNARMLPCSMVLSIFFLVTAKNHFLTALVLLYKNWYYSTQFQNIQPLNGFKTLEINYLVISSGPFIWYLCLQSAA